MKTTKKLLSILLAMVMLFTLALPAFAEETGESDPTTPTTYTITIKDTLKGETYTLYKLFGATTTSDRAGSTNNEADGIAYTGDIPAGLEQVFEKNDLGVITQKLDNEATINAINAWLRTENAAKYKVAGNEVTATGNTVEFTVSEQGYYAVYSPLSATAGVVVLTSIAPDATIVDKHEPEKPTKPEPEKRLKTVENGSEDGSKVTAELGETITFNVAFKGVNYAENDKKERVLVTEYNVIDTPTGLKLADKATVTIGSNLSMEIAITKVEGTDNYQITIPWADTTTGTSLYDNNTLVTVTYTAVVTEAGAQNIARVDFNGDQKGTEPDPDPVKVYTASIVVDKIDGADATGTTKLPGAKFVLQNKTDGKYYTFDETAKKVVWVDTQTKEAVQVTDDKGAITFKGLKDGTYTLTEIEAPAGYNKAEKPEEITISALNGNNQTVEYTKTVQNSKGTVLPSTGGIGTTIFYVVGGLLVLGAAVVLISKKRMGNQQ